MYGIHIYMYIEIILLLIIHKHISIYTCVCLYVCAVCDDWLHVYMLTLDTGIRIDGNLVCQKILADCDISGSPIHVDRYFVLPNILFYLTTSYPLHTCFVWVLVCVCLCASVCLNRTLHIVCLPLWNASVIGFLFVTNCEVRALPFHAMASLVSF